LIAASSFQSIVLGTQNRRAGGAIRRRYGSDEAPPNDGRLDLDELLSQRT